MSYEKNAATAKKEFLRELGGCNAVVNRLGKFRVNYIAELVEMTPPSVSRFLQDPAKISENFIRKVAENVPGMELCYARFRVTADEGFIPFKLYEFSKTRQRKISDVDRAMAKFLDHLDAQKELIVKKVTSALAATD